MTRTSPAGRNPWLPAFILAVGSLVASLASLVAVLISAAAGDGTSAADRLPRVTAEGGAALPATSSGILRYTGALPPPLGQGYERAASAGDADLVFEWPSASPDAVPLRYFVPVVPLHSGLDNVSAEQLAGLLAGRLTFARAGGLGEAPVRFAVAGPERDRAAVRGLSALAGQDFGESYDALFAAMAEPGAALVAFVPIESLRPSVSPLAVDGVDIVRGDGDPGRWPFAERVLVQATSRRGQDALPAVVAAVQAVPPRITTVVATGDILQSRCSLAAIEATGDWGAALRGPVGAYLAAADLALGSLDGSIQDVGTPWGCVSTTNLTSPPQVMAALTLAGIDGVTVATNHVFDCGQEFCGTKAFQRTLELLDQAGIKHVGGGANLEAALAPAIFEVNGVRFGVLGFDDIAAYALEATDTAWGTAPLDDSYADENAAGEPAFFRPASELSLTRFTQRIRALKAQVDVVIVQVQSGTENTHTPSPRSLKALRAAADAGADLVIGNQAHWVQAVETRGDAFIAYALGNFIFDQVWSPEFTQGYLVEATFHGKQFVAVKLVPYQIEERYRPVFVAGSTRTKILGDVYQATAELPAVTPR